MGKIKVETSQFFCLFQKAWKQELIGAVSPMEHDNYEVTLKHYHVQSLGWVHPLDCL